jgi:hypothetical protein
MIRLKVRTKHLFGEVLWTHNIIIHLYIRYGGLKVWRFGGLSNFLGFFELGS